MALIEIVSMDRLIKPVGEWDWIYTYAWLVWFDRLEDWLLRVLSLLLLFVQSFGEFFFFGESRMTKKKRNKWNTVLIQSINKEIKNRYFVVTLFRKSVYLFESVVFDVEKKIVRSNFKRLFYFKGWSNIFWIVNLSVCDMR